MEDELGGMVRSVARARKALEAYKATLAELTEKIDQLVQEHYGADLAKTTEQIALAQEVVESTETSLRKAILARFTFTGEKHPLDGINVREVSKYEYEDEQAITWCRKQLPGALKLDRKAFEAVVKSGALPVDFVTVRTEPVATIAGDLSAYLDEGDAC